MGRRRAAPARCTAVTGALVAVAIAVASAPATGAAPPPGGGATTSPSGVPVVAALAAGEHQSCGLLGDGRVSCWGENDRAQLGLGDEEHRGDDPGEMGAHLLTVDLGTGRTATAVTIGNEHMCALLDDGSVKCWGRNDFGTLGLGDREWRGDEPGEMGDALPTVDLGTGRTATAVAAGRYHTCALLDDGTVKCWGDNGEGELGLGDTTDRGDQPGEMGDALPAVDLGTGRTATAITAGRSHVCVQLDDGSLKCWGYNRSGQLGLGDDEFRGDEPGEMGDALPTVDLGTGRTVSSFVAGGLHTCALLDGGAVKCWGYNTFGQLGLGGGGYRGDQPNEMGDSLPEVDLGTGREAVAFAPGAVHTCALLDDASVRCWGANDEGQLGLGDTSDRGDNPGEMGDALPAVDLGTGRAATALSARGSTCALLDDGTARCWGGNLDGRLGLGDEEARGDQPGEMGDALPPVAVSGDGVTGRVTGAPGGVLPGALVAILDPADFSLDGGAVANDDGRYTTPVPAGAHLAYALGPTDDHQPGFLGAPDLLAVGGGLTVIGDGELEARTGAVTGTVTDATSGAPVAGAYALALDPGTGAIERGAPADASGSFTLAGLQPGSHLVAYLDRSGAHDARFSGGVPDPGSATAVTVAAGGATVADAALPARPALPGGTALTGRVRGASAPHSLVVALRADDLSFARAALTNPTGGYGLAVPAGRYLLGVVDTTGAHRFEWFDDRAADGLAQATPVVSPATVDLEPDAAVGSVAGTVADRDGAPVAGAWVVVVRPSGVAGTAVTAADGTYGIDGLPPDNYRAAFVHPASGARVYWPAAPTYEDGAVFVVGAGSVSGLNAELDVTGGAP